MTAALRIGLIGADIARSRTPAMHMAEARAQGLDLTYDLIDLTPRGLGPEDLPQLLTEAEAAGYAGLNITHPCKQRVIAHLDALSPEASALGAVNTVVLRGGRRVGHNTDWSGFHESFRARLPDVARGEVLQMGAGGAGAAVGYAGLNLGLGRLHIADIAPARASALADLLNAIAGRDFARPCADPEARLARVEGLINTTPVGMAAHPGLPLDLAQLRPDHWVAEIVYFPLETALLAQARARGCRTLSGAGMAVHQAVAAFALFTGLVPDAARMRAQFDSL